MSRSSTITDRWDVGEPAEWLHNPHAGEILALDFMEPLGMSADQLAQALDVPADLVSSIVDGAMPLDGEFDLRLARYFGMSPGFFLGLQLDYEVMEAKRTLHGALDKVVPRAA